MAGKKQEQENTEQELSIEETFAEIEKRIRILEQEDAGLEVAFEAYKEGMDLVRRCDASISRIEKRVQQIAEDGSLSDLDGE